MAEQTEKRKDGYIKIPHHKLTKEDVLLKLAAGANIVIGKEGNFIEVVLLDTDMRMYVIIAEKMPAYFCWALFPQQEGAL